MDCNIENSSCGKDLSLIHIFRVDTKKNLLTMGILPFQDLENKFVLWQQDLKGNVLQSISSTPYYTYDDYSNEVSSNRNAGSFDFFIFNWSAVQDSRCV